MQNHAILHSDLNCFYASVETMLDPRLRGKAIAVCGSTEGRQGGDCPSRGMLRLLVRVIIVLNLYLNC